MANIQDQIAQAKAAGYSDADIAQHLSTNPDYQDKIKKATDAGYQPSDIVSHLSGGASTAAPASNVSDKDVAKAVSDALSTVNPFHNLQAGLLRGAGSIGATLMYPIDKATDLIQGDRSPNLGSTLTGSAVLSRNEERRKAIDEGLKNLVGADPESLQYKTGKLGGEIAGTAGVGPLVGAGLRAAPLIGPAIEASPTLQKLVQAISSSGTTTGAPAATTVGGKLADLALRSAGGATSGGAQAALANPDQGTVGAVIGASIPAVGSTLKTVGGGLKNVLFGSGASPDVAALAEKAKQLGIDIPADRIVNSKPLNALASALNYVPLSGRAATESAMQDQLNTALSKTVGQNSPNVTQALRAAQSDLGSKFDNVLQNNTVNVDKQLLTDLTDAANKATKELSPDQAKIIHNQIDEILSKGESGQIDGQAAYNIKKTLDRIGNRNAPEAYYARDVKSALMDSLNRSLSPEDAQAFATTRRQYSNMLKLENLAQNGAEGDISIARLANMKNINSPDLQDLADISAQFLKGREGQHGAAQRALSGLAAGSFAGPPALAGGVAAGRLANTALNSNLVKNMALNVNDPATQNALTAILSAASKTAPVIGSQGSKK